MYENVSACAECGGPVLPPASACMECGAPLAPGAIGYLAGAEPWCCLTEQDVRLLEQAAAIHGGPDSAIGRAVAEKIGGAAVELCDAIPPGYVTLNSRVVFRVNGGDPISRVLVHWDMFFVPGLDLSLATPWGITLLGLKVGHEVSAYWRDGTAERIVVEAIPFRPVIARRRAAPVRQSRDAEAGIVRLGERRSRRAAAWAPGSGFDDPGPTAA
jgi:regulator of nucleoside diphosphate kinase